MQMWNNAGVVEYQFSDVKITPTPDHLTVDYYGKTRTFLFDGIPLSFKGSFSEKLTFPRNELPYEKYAIPYQHTYHISSRENVARLTLERQQLYSVPQGTLDIHPADVILLFQPHIEYDHLGFHHLIIPLSVTVAENQVIVDGYRAQSPQIGYNILAPSGKFRRSSDDTSWIIWRCCLLPLPLALDIITLPIQFTALLFLH